MGHHGYIKFYSLPNIVSVLWVTQICFIYERSTRYKDIKLKYIFVKGFKLKLKPMNGVFVGYS